MNRRDASRPEGAYGIKQRFHLPPSGKVLRVRLHEGNYSLPGILSGARAQEQLAAKK
jgi:hypothetical protein